MKKLKFALFILCIFCFGHVAGLNLSTLYPNPDYSAGWHKIAFTAFLAILFASCAWAVARKDSE